MDQGLNEITSKKINIFLSDNGINSVTFFYPFFCLFLYIFFFISKVGHHLIKKNI